jgi:hypothetical protein
VYHSLDVLWRRLTKGQNKKIDAAEMGFRFTLADLIPSVQAINKNERKINKNQHQKQQHLNFR